MWLTPIQACAWVTIHPTQVHRTTASATTGASAARGQPIGVMKHTATTATPAVGILYTTYVIDIPKEKQLIYLGTGGSPPAPHPPAG